MIQNSGNSITEKSFLKWSIAGFFLLNCANLLLRPLRDETGIHIGTQHLQWLFSGTFAILLLISVGFAFLKRRYAIPKLMNGTYLLLLGLLLLFFIFYNTLHHLNNVRWIFFIGISVFNLFSISLYWSVMVEILDKASASRIFGKVAAGGSSGAIAGSFLATWISFWFGASGLLLSSILALGIFLFFQNKLLQSLQPQVYTKRNFSFFQFLQPIHLTFSSSFFSAMALSNFIYAIMNTFLYYQQLALVENTFTIQKTTLLAIIASVINIATLMIQLFFFSKWINNKKSIIFFIAVPLLTVATFICLAWQPSILLLIISSTIHRAGNYSIIKPLREVYYTTINREDKFGTKNFVDTIFSRGGDLTGSWWYSCLFYNKLLLLLSIISLGTVWIFNSRQLAKKHYD